MQSKILKFLIFTLLSSCSHLSRNQTKVGELHLNGGRYKNQKWEEKLKFKRATWFLEVSAVFDGLFYKVDKNSPYYSWFDQIEKEKINSCGSFVVALFYNLDSAHISRGQFKDQMAKNGFDEFLVMNFEDYIKNHHDINIYRLGLYHLSGFCHPLDKKELVIDFPSYDEVKIEL